MTRDKINWAQALNFLLAFTFILTQSWFADALEGNEMFHWVFGGVHCNQTCGADFWFVEVALLLISVLCAMMLYRRRRTFLPVTVQRISEPDQVDAHQVLVLPISNTSSYEWKEGTLWEGERSVLSEDSVKEALGKMSGLKPQFSWEQMLRSIVAHDSALRRIVLVGSKTKNGRPGTEMRFDECEEMIRYYFPDKHWEIEHRKADFDSLDELLDVYRGIIVSEKHRKRHLMIDVTGGTKVVSIAAAMVSLEHPEIEFQYVETDGDKRVRSFNVVTPVKAQES